MDKQYEKIDELSTDLLNILFLLSAYCRENSDMQEIECIYSALKIIIKKADILKLEISRLTCPFQPDDK